MTLLLRPFNFETLPTYVYQFAKDELLEEAALRPYHCCRWNSARCNNERGFE